MFYAHSSRHFCIVASTSDPDSIPLHSLQKTTKTLSLGLCLGRTTDCSIHGRIWSNIKFIWPKYDMTLSFLLTFYLLLLSIIISLSCCWCGMTPVFQINEHSTTTTTTIKQFQNQSEWTHELFIKLLSQLYSFEQNRNTGRLWWRTQLYRDGHSTLHN